MLFLYSCPIQCSVILGLYLVPQLFCRKDLRTQGDTAVATLLSVSVLLDPFASGSGHSDRSVFAPRSHTAIIPSNTSTLSGPDPYLSADREAYATLQLPTFNLAIS